MKGNVRQRSAAGVLFGIGLLVLFSVMVGGIFAIGHARAEEPETVTVSQGVRPKFYPVESVRAGVKGYGYTVVQGMQVERFPVEVLGLVKKAGPTGGDLVLVRVGGAPVEVGGGIAAGMSGSPVFIGDTLLGAIGYGFELADPTLGLVTPAGDMAKVMTLLVEAEKAVEAEEGHDEVGAPGEAAETSEAAATSLVGTAEREETSGTGLPVVAFVAGDREQALGWKATFGADALVFAPVATPVIVTGLGQRALDRLRQGMAPYPVEVRTGISGLAGGGIVLPRTGTGTGSGSASAGESNTEQPFPAPGQAFAVQLVRGDVDISALGTITWVEDNKLVGFGHPFLNKGETRFFMGPAYVVGTVTSMAMPFKIGYPLEAMGTLGQDRSAGVAGRVGALPPSLKVEVKVREKGRTPVTTRAEVVWDEELVDSLVGPVLLQSVDRALVRTGKGMATVKVQGRIEGTTSTTTRTNLFASWADIAAAAVQEAVELVDLVARNPFRSVRMTQLSVDVEVSPELRMATIESVRAPSVPVRPGQKVELQVGLRPFRGEPETRLVVVTLPENLTPGPLTITVRGGSSYGGGPRDEQSTGVGGPGETNSGEGDWYYGESEDQPPQSLEELLDEFVKRERNNDLVAEFWPEPDGYGTSDGEGGKGESAQHGQAGSPRDGQPPAGNGAQDGEKTVSQRKPVKVVLPTPYVIAGWIDVDIEVASAAGAPDSEAGEATK